jgi:uncharacterized protein (TIGR03086 family)
MTATDTQETVNLLDAMDRALAAVSERVDAITADQWADPTPCSQWNVADLVDHLVWGNLFCGAVADGVTPEKPERAADLVQGWLDSVPVIRAAFARPGLIDGEVQMPLSRISGAHWARMKIGGLVVHSWDLSRAIGADETMDDDLMQIAYDFFSTERAKGALTEDRFGVDGLAGNDLSSMPLLTRLLLSAGRTP